MKYERNWAAWCRKELYATAEPPRGGTVTSFGSGGQLEARWRGPGMGRAEAMSAQSGRHASIRPSHYYLGRNAATVMGRQSPEALPSVHRGPGACLPVLVSYLDNFPHDAVLFLVLFLCAQTAVGIFQATAGINLRLGPPPILFCVPKGKGARVLHWVVLHGSAQCQSLRHAKSGGCSQCREMLLAMGDLLRDARVLGCHTTQACQQSGWNR